MKYILLAIAAIVLWGCAPGETTPAQPTEEKIPVKVVVLAMFELGEATGDRPGEFQYWAERLPLDSVISFPQGYRDLRYNADKQVLGMVTGIGTARAAASVMALGLDERFDFSNTYWLVAGIAGVDPQDASVGSAAWAEWVIDGDLSHEIDAREIPDDWQTGYVPLRSATPYEQPLPEDNEGAAFQLNPSLVEWAYQLTKDTPLDDNENITNFRALYKGHPNAQRPPFVLKGDQLAAMTYWHGKLMNQWANDWTDYWTQGEGNFVTSAMEDTGTLTSLSFLSKANKVDLDRVMVLRTASNYTMQYEGISAAESLSGEKLKGKGYTAFLPSLEAAYKVGSQVVNEISDNWDKYQNEIPQP
ncbi:purine nucleoside permease [Porifericola rhodea]|uniref:purine nucleoside permease n=1 Tax=Porifericola rhodea TaxID=930972 RepID=UPI0026667D5E|nr:purine nucleoside permease [Porifericola rhodea]WKN30412.1 purine nucleoside permease [Porifericola rhodea]